MAAHSHECEKADVGSFCDCDCAGSKHAVKRTVGGVPGAGGVSKAARAAAEKAGVTPVVNNRAVPADGHRVAPSAPKAFKVAHAQHAAKEEASKAAAAQFGKNLAAAMQSTRDTFRKAVADSEAWSRGQLAKIKADNPGMSTADAIKKGRSDPEFKKRLAAHHEAFAQARRDGLNNREIDKIVAEERQKADKAQFGNPPAENAGNVAGDKPAGENGAGARKTTPDGGGGGGAVPAVKVPAPLRDILAVVDNPDAHMDTAAAARYQKITPDLMLQMSPEQKQAMLDDIRSRAKAYKPKSPTGQKLERAFNTINYASDRHKAGMKAGPQHMAGVGQNVTHGEHGHGKVVERKVTEQAAVVDFGDKKVTVPQNALTFGHVGDDKPAAAAGKAAAGAAKDTARAEKSTAALAGFGAKMNAGGNWSSAGLNEISHYDKAAFDRLTPAQRTQVVDGLRKIAGGANAKEVKERAAAAMATWTGQRPEVAPEPTPEHIRQAHRALNGQSTSLPYSMTFAQVSEGQLRQHFTPEERAKMHAKASQILAGMRQDAPDRAGLARAIDKLEAVDGKGGAKVDDSAGKVNVTSTRRGRGTPTSEQLPAANTPRTVDDIRPGFTYVDHHGDTVTVVETPGKIKGFRVTTKNTDKPMLLSRTQMAADARLPRDAPAAESSVKTSDTTSLKDLRIKAREAELRSMRKDLPFEQRDQARQQMHDIEAQVFALENPHRTPGPGASTFKGKKVADVPQSRRDALEAIAANPSAKITLGQSSGLRRAGFATDGMGTKHLTDKGHIALAAARGDGKHQAMNEQIADLDTEHAKAAAAVKAHYANKSPYDRYHSQVGFELQQAEKTAYGRANDARFQRSAYLKGDTAGKGEADTPPAETKPGNAASTPADGGDAEHAAKLAAKETEVKRLNEEFSALGAQQAGSGSMRTKRFAQQGAAYVRRLAQKAEEVKKAERELDALRKGPAKVSPTAKPAGSFTPDDLHGKKFIKTRYGWYEVTKVNRTTVKVKPDRGTIDDVVQIKKIIDAR